MFSLINLPEQEEREVLEELLSYILFAAFGATTEFDHRYDSSLEHVARCLHYFDPHGMTPTGFATNMTRSDFIAIIWERPLKALPLIEDLMDVAINLSTWRHATGNTGSLYLPVKFEDPLQIIFEKLNFFQDDMLPGPQLSRMLLDDYFFHEPNYMWSDYDEFFEELAHHTWQTAPDSFRIEFISQPKRRSFFVTNCFDKQWRFGVWLNEVQQQRTFIEPNSNRALPGMIEHKLDKDLSSGRIIYCSKIA